MKYRFCVLLSVLILSTAAAQEVLPEPEVTPNPLVPQETKDLDSLLETALSAAEDGNWDLALSTLEEARKIAPDDPRIESYNISIGELYALDEAQKSWAQGNPSEVQTQEPEQSAEAPPQEEDQPKFAIDRGNADSQTAPSGSRDVFRGDIGVRLFAVDPVLAQITASWSPVRNFFSSSFTTDIWYWLPLAGRSLGFNLRSSGYAWPIKNPDIMLNSLDAGVNLRGFVLEDAGSRTEIGLDFGYAYQSLNSAVTMNQNALYLGIWGSSPVFFHLFSAEKLRPLTFSAALRIYASEGTDNILTYNFETAWRARRFTSGLRFTWWDFTNGAKRVSLPSLVMFAGLRF